MLGKSNWAGLSNYLVKQGDMELFQTYLKSDIQESVINARTSGIIYGGKLSVVSGLVVRVSAGAAIMPISGLLVNWVQTDLTLSAADLINGRLDRIELSALSTAGATVIDEAGLNKTLDFQYITTLAVVAGTPSGSPVLPTQTVGKISVGSVSVPATAVALTGANLFQIPRAGHDKSYDVLGNGSGFISFNESTSQLDFSADGITWQQVQLSAFQNISTSVANNQVALADVSGFQLDTSKGKSYRVMIQITRQTSLSKLRCYGHVDFIYNENTSAWDIVPSTSGDVDLCGIVLSSVLLSGTVSKIQYTSDSISGTGYTGTIKFSVKDIL